MAKLIHNLIRATSNSVAFNHFPATLAEITLIIFEVTIIYTYISNISNIDNVSTVWSNYSKKAKINSVWKTISIVTIWCFVCKVLVLFWNFNISVSNSKNTLLSPRQNLQYQSLVKHPHSWNINYQKANIKHSLKH